MEKQENLLGLGTKIHEQLEKLHSALGYSNLREQGYFYRVLYTNEGYQYQLVKNIGKSKKKDITAFVKEDEVFNFVTAMLLGAKDMNKSLNQHYRDQGFMFSSDQRRV